MPEAKFDFTLTRRRFLEGLAATGVLSSLATPVPAQEDDSKPARTKHPIRIGQIGVGHAHATKLSVYRESRDYEVVGVVEPNEELRRAAEKRPAYRGVRWMTQAELLSTPGLQAVLVETEIRDLLNTADACLAAGKHIHLDKPPGHSLPQFEQLLSSAARQDLLVQLGYMWRYHPAVLLLREFLNNGWLGEVFEVTAVIGKRCTPEERTRFAEFPGGIMFEIGCHMLDLAISVLGAPDKVISLRQQLSKEDHLTDHVVTLLHYPRAIADVRINALEVDGGPQRRFVVYGTEGTFHIQPMDGAQARLTLQQPRGKYSRGMQSLTFPKFTRYVADAADMAQIIRGEKAPSFSREHDLAVQRTLLLAGQATPG